MPERISFNPESNYQDESAINSEILPSPLKLRLAEAKMNIQLRYIRNKVNNSVL